MAFFLSIGRIKIKKPFHEIPISEIDDLKLLFDRAARLHYNARTLPGCPSILNRTQLSDLLDAAERLNCLSREDLASSGVDYVMREDEILGAGEVFSKAAAVEITYRLKSAVREAYFKELSPFKRLMAYAIDI